MGWREVLAQTLADAQNDNGDGTRSDVYYPPNPRAAAWVEVALHAMPDPDRIALARELLAGTGCEVIDENGKDIIRAISYTAGYDAASEEMDTP